METLLRIRSKLCYILAMIIAVFTLVLLTMLIANYLPEFMEYPLSWIVSFFPQDNDILLFMCFIGLVSGLLFVPGIIIFGLVKRGQYLELQARRKHRMQPIMNFKQV